MLNIQKIRIYVLIPATILFMACANNPNTITGDTAAVQDSLQGNANLEDSLRFQKKILENAYIAAIADYLKCISARSGDPFDTIYIGKQIEFPDIDLPESVLTTHIVVLAPEKIEAKKSLYNKHCPYINLIGSCDNRKAEFIFVTFFPGFDHKFDCYLNYNFANAAMKLSRSRIEELILNKNGEPSHFAVYENGTYVGQRSIPKNQH